MKRRPIALLFGFLLASVLFFAASANAWAADYYEALEFDLTLNPDGSLSYQEEMWGHFESGYGAYTLEVEHQNYSTIEDVAVSVNGQPLQQTETANYEADTPGYFYASDQGNPFAEQETDNTYIEWYVERDAVDYQFSLRYMAHDAVQVYEDVAEFTWQPISADGMFEVKQAVIRVHLPAGADLDEIRAWGHGPLHGNVEINSPTLVTLTLEDIYPGDYMEVRLAMPNSLFPQATMLSGNRLETILAEEEALAQQANAERTNVKLQMILIPISLVAILLLAIWMRRKASRNNPYLQPQEAPKYFRDLPSEDIPALVYTLMTYYPKGRRLCGDEGNKISATLLDLTARGIITAQESEEGLFTKGQAELTLVREAYEKAELSEYERKLLQLCFEQIAPAGEPLRPKDIKRYAKHHANRMLAELNELDALLDREAKQKYYGPSASYGKQFLTAFLPPFLLGLLLAISGLARILGIAMAVFGILVPLLAFIGFSTKRLNQTGENQFALWLAFRNFLEDFSQFDKKELPELALWERYLPYAAALGVADQLLKQLPVAYPQLQEYGYTDFYLLYLMMYRGGYGSYMQSVRSISDSLHTARQTINMAKSSSSSGGGFGGGFSGGGGFGGFGGGGGSHGAR